MKRVFLLILSVIQLLIAAFGLSACGIHKTSEEVLVPNAIQEVDEQAEIVPAEPKEEVPEAELSEEPPTEELSAIEVLAASLPPKPDVNIYSWEFRLANSYNSIGEYQLTYSSFEGQGLDQNAVQAATDFIHAVRNAGFYAWCSTANRNYEYLDSHYRGFVYRLGDPVEAANRMLGPGLSDHQTGLAIDFTDRSEYDAFYDEFDDSYMKDTELYQWLTEHCAEYGFILRYPEGKEEFYGVACQHPAHFRYVGKEAAEYIMKNNLCLEEFIMLYDESLVFLPKP
ncbi:MAG: M15 family metallopeptidase [Oscillospiraceae bacterium]|nr:M15 family metallopeptidase [Oscillospiraceae bacterium]